jgi:hypothetical protein
VAPKLYNTPNVLHNPAEQFAGQAAPLTAPTSSSAALASQKKMRESGIQTTKAAYLCGATEASIRLGLVKESGRINPLLTWFRRLLEGPYGEYAARFPVQSGMGALAGAATGQLHSEKPGKGALLGALTGGMGGLAVAAAPHLRTKLIRVLGGV